MREFPFSYFYAIRASSQTSLLSSQPHPISLPNLNPTQSAHLFPLTNFSISPSSMFGSSRCSHPTTATSHSHHHRGFFFSGTFSCCTSGRIERFVFSLSCCFNSSTLSPSGLTSYLTFDLFQLPSTILTFLLPEERTPSISFTRW